MLLDVFYLLLCVQWTVGNIKNNVDLIKFESII